MTTHDGGVEGASPTTGKGQDPEARAGARTGARTGAGADDEAVGSSVLAMARDLAPETVVLRRELHTWPEVGLDLPGTQRRVLAALDGLGLHISTGHRLSSVRATLTGATEGPTILLRADMDALPLTEDTGRDFASRTPGVMHACGHDAHTAMLVGAARLLAKRRAELSGRVVFMFQPGEEGDHGARHMIDEGVLKGVDAAFALHVTPNLPSGTLHLRPGTQMAASDRVQVTVQGRGGHASAPHTTCDPVPVACEIVLALQTTLTRMVAADDAAVLSITRLTAGTAHGIIPDTAQLAGTLRTLKPTTRERLLTALHRVADGVAAAHGAKADVRIDTGYPVTVNDPAFTDLVLRTAADVLGRRSVDVLPAPPMTAEDFSYVLGTVPGALAFLGACPPGLTPEGAPSLHSSRADFDEAALTAGIACHAAVALAYTSTSHAERPR
ncbi:M20 family metallopeptidase [Streptomyces sp. M41]|uniref:M20 metallopeptidase family protein n=1 Tax=Streptomyces sp. M41 TaxID=3059412 RepID=UPI00374DF870